MTALQKGRVLAVFKNFVRIEYLPTLLAKLLKETREPISAEDWLIDLIELANEEKKKIQSDPRYGNIG